MTLEELAVLQLEFSRALEDPAPSPRLPQSWLLAGVSGSERRFARYRSGLWQHQEQSLPLTHPVIKALVGDEFFRTLAFSYGQRYPSHHPDLGRFGEHLAEFLGTYVPVAAYPYFADVAALEWAVHCACTASDVNALDARAMAAIGAQALESTQLTLAPGCALVSSGWPIFAIWAAHNKGDQSVPKVAGGACSALVYRSGWRVEVREVDAWEFTALARLLEHATLGDALLAAQEHYAMNRDDGAFIDSAAWVTRWLCDGLLVAIP